MHKNHIAIIYPSGSIKVTNVEKEKRILEFKNLGYDVTDLPPKHPSPEGCTSSPTLERATLLSYALTMRKFSIIMSERGGVGTTELVPFLENLLPPVIPKKILLGFSDISFLGVYLATRYPNLTYVHSCNFFSKNLFQSQKMDEENFFNILNKQRNTHVFPIQIIHNNSHYNNKNLIEGKCIPINLSLAESISSCQFIQITDDNILFLEECNEYIYRIIRKIDSLINSGFLNNTKAIVIGNFTNSLNNNDEPVDRKYILDLFAKKTKLPIIDLPIFGHTIEQFPLVMNSQIKVVNNKIFIPNFIEEKSNIATTFSPTLFNFREQNKISARVHLTGIGGTGMAQVAGFFVEAGKKVTGSDNPIYPPMDKIIANLNITPDIGFLSENISKNNPDYIVLANVVSRLSANLKPNDELEEILSQNIPVLSFPSALRKHFLHSSLNVVISGTHGKTTTSSLIAYLFDTLEYKPSFLIGGSPVNFKAGFSLRSRNLFVLEGDEYDSAFFDKGPKFLHYEPKICLINNIEFDHADIYENVEAIESEFKKLAHLTRDRSGYVIANLDDNRVLNIAEESFQNGGKIIGFSKHSEKNRNYPTWCLKKFVTLSTGMEITIETPTKKVLTFQTKIFGEHNALNCVAAFAALHAHELLEKQTSELNFLEKAMKAMKDFKGVKRRFELLEEKNNIAVFDDFAHHPTAIEKTIQAFKDYIKSTQKTGKLIICFDPRNATMRRNILQKELINSFAYADKLYLGKIPQDLRMKSEDVLNGPAVAEACGPKARYFDNNENLLTTLKNEVRSGDTVVFMSSGSFDGIPHKFASIIENMP
jgi:UDP-N-acetylmuramate: L-alanyl-gamma-D-glutamyl-meso-diaminopimelate ligase